MHMQVWEYTPCPGIFFFQKFVTLLFQSLNLKICLCVFYNVKNRFQKVDIMIMKNKVIISIIPSIELQSVKLLLKGNFCSILIKCWIKSTPFLLITGTLIT